MTTTDLARIRDLLAKHLPGMRTECNVYHSDGVRRIHLPRECPGYQPAPLTARGRIDLDLLLEAIEAEGGDVNYNVYHSDFADIKEWSVRDPQMRTRAYGADLGIAYLQAKG